MKKTKRNKNCGEEDIPNKELKYARVIIKYLTEENDYLKNKKMENF